MAQVRFFSINNQSPIRVVDYISKQNKQEWQETMLLFDKKMSTVLTCMQYDKALAKGSAEIGIYRQKMHQLLDEAYHDFVPEIKAGIKYQQNADRINEDLKRMAQEIAAIKKDGTITRDIIEVACLKLAILRDEMHDTQRFLMPSVDEDPNIKKPSLKNSAEIIKMPLSNALHIKQLTKGRISTPVSCNEYPSITNILPIYSANGSMGFNTILFAIFNDYLPVGFSKKPFAVHNGAFENESIETTRHDYGHALNRVLALQQKAPETFAVYKETYHKIFAHRQAHLSDDIMVQKEQDLILQKDLLMLFFLVYERCYYPHNLENASVVDIINKNTKLPSSQFLQLASVDPSLLKLSLIEVIDFKHPLELVGYKIRSNPEKPYESAPDFRAALLDILKGFASRYPNVALEPKKEHVVTNGF